MKRLQIKARKPIIQDQADRLEVIQQFDNWTSNFYKLRHEHENAYPDNLKQQIIMSKMIDAKKTVGFLWKQIADSISIEKKFLHIHFLMTPAGQVVSTKAFCGQYGIAFITDQSNGIKKYINAAKRPETYRKNGVIICEAKVELRSAVYLHKTEGLVYAFRIGAISPVKYNYNRINTSVSIAPEIEEAVKGLDPQRWIKFFNKY